MKIINGIDQLSRKYKNPVVAIGVFDGVHRGHQRLLKMTVKRAKILGGTPILMTFNPHPIHVLRPDLRLPLIVSFPFRLKLIESYGINVCVVVHFTRKFSHLSPERFIKSYLVDKINPKEVIVGDDFRFGQNREGTLDLFQKAGEKYGFHVHVLDSREKGEKTVSSSKIRDLVMHGKLNDARRLLGRPFAIMAEVKAGSRRGRKLGYPTANIIPMVEILPPNGVYIVRVLHKNRHFNAIANLGVRPSFESSNKIILEVHLLDFKKRLYGTTVVVEFFKKIRDERKFLNSESLVKQIRNDELTARNFFSAHNS